MNKDLAGKASQSLYNNGLRHFIILSAERKANKAGQVTLPLPFGGFSALCFPSSLFFLQSNWAAARINNSQHNLTYQREVGTDVRGSGKGF